MFLFLREAEMAMRFKAGTVLHFPSGGLKLRKAHERTCFKRDNCETPAK